jgi:hypothetical protein
LVKFIFICGGAAFEEADMFAAIFAFSAILRQNI